MKMHKIPATSYLHECFVYNEITGALFWKRRPRHHFYSDKGYNVFNGRFAGKEILGLNNGYKVVKVGPGKFFAHRVIWKMVTGNEPVEIVDHKDRDRSNNRWLNLREATHTQNRINNNKIMKGISCFKGRWRLKVTYTVDNFASREEALAAKQRMSKIIYGEFSPYHDRDAA